MNKFYEDVAGAESDFPQYSFIEPTYFGESQNDQHPPSDVKRGEVRIADVYNALRTNQDLWEKSLLLILYDEHGGFYDHVTPPAAIPPDDHVKDFSFTQYGVRVPAILISPWVRSGVIHDEFDHTSLLKYVTDKWGLGPLGNRVAAARSFSSYIGNGLTSPRSDTPSFIDPREVIENPIQNSLNAHQSALIGFSRYLETQMHAIKRGAGKDEPEIFKSASERLISSMHSVEQHDKTAMMRLEVFLNLKKDAGKKDHAPKSFLEIVFG